MRKRTSEEIEAYVDGYNACFKQFCKVLPHTSKYIGESIEKMRLYVVAVNSVIDKEDKNEI